MTLSLAATGAAFMLNLALEPWRTINDNVMGGISTGRMVQSGKGLVFEGKLSLENNGGFASVRRMVSEDLSATRGVRLKVQGDGRVYQFRARTSPWFDGPAWRMEFATNGEVEIFEFDFKDFEPVFRGRRLSDMGLLDPAQVQQIGFLVADKKAGAFSLQVLEIEILR